jgi:hypothetical protein
MPELSERRLAALLAACPEPRFDATRLARLGDRLERSFRRQAPRRAWWRYPAAWAAAAVMALAILPGLWWTQQPLPMPSAMVSAAAPTIRLGNTGDPPAVSGPCLVPAEQSLRIDGGPAKLRWTDGTVLALDAGTVASLIDGGDGAKRIRLTRGRLAAEVAAQPDGHPLRIVTPQSELSVLGTTFSLEADALTTRLAVTHGSVAMRRANDPAAAVVTAGEVALASATAAPLARPAAALPLRDPGFELPLTTDAKTGWHMDVRNNDSLARLVQDTCIQGRQSLLLEQFKPITWPPELAEHPDFQVFINGPNGGRGHASVSQNFPVLAGRTYDFSFAWRSHGLGREVRAVGPGRGYVKFSACLFWLRADGERCVPGQEVLAAFDDAAAWTTWPPPEQAERGRKPAPPDAVTAAISFKLSTAVAGRTVQVWVDDVDFVAE